MNNKLIALLSEIDSLKKKLSALRPLPAGALEKIKEALEIEYTYESNRMEGNTLTLQETALIVNEGVTISGKSMREHLEAINHDQAIDFINDLAGKKELISERTVKDIHGIILQGIDRENAGKYRTVQVMISGSKHMPPPPFAINEEMENFIAGYDAQSMTGIHPVIIAAYLHAELVKIHPFIDGNGRTARLLMNLHLLSNGYPIVNLKSEQEQRIRYYSALEAYVNGKSEDFKILVAEAVKESLERYIGIILN